MPDIAKWENFMYCLVTEKKAFFERGWRGGGGCGREGVCRLTGICVLKHPEKLLSFRNRNHGRYCKGIKKIRRLFFKRLK